MRRDALASVAVVLALLLTPVAMPTTADAVSININIGTNLSFGRGITCREGERQLRNRGFRDIVRTDCRGRNFTYRASRGGSRWEISVRSSNGRIVDYRRIRRLR